MPKSIREPGVRQLGAAGVAAATRAASRRRLVLSAFVVPGLLALAAGIGLREPMPPDEPRFVLMARHMVETGQWLFPWRGSELYAEKPPVFMWLQACAYLLVGHWRLAFLLPSLLAAAMTAWFVHDAARRLWNARVARHALLALFVTLQFGLQAKRAQIDMVLLAMSTGALWALLRVLLAGAHVRWAGFGGLLAGLGTVTKGVGFLPLLVLPLQAALHRGSSLPSRWPRGTVAWALAGFVLGVSAWLLPMLLGVLASDDPAHAAYARDLLWRQTGQRYAEPWHHLRPAWHYLQVMATLWLPGVLLLPWLLPAWMRRLRRGDARIRLLLAWGVCVLLFFSITPGKREVYILPALPAFCLAAAPLLPALWRRTGVRRLVVGYVVALGLMAAIAAGLLAADPQGRFTRLADTRGLSPLVLPVLALWLAGLAAVVAVATGVWRRRRPALLLFVATCALWTCIGIGIVPAISDDSSSRHLMRRAGDHIGPQGQLALLAWREQQLLQADRPVREFGFRRPWHLQWIDAARWLAGDPSRRWLLVRDEALGPCVDRRLVHDVGVANRRRWHLVPAAAVRPGCVVPPFAPVDRRTGAAVREARATQRNSDVSPTTPRRSPRQAVGIGLAKG